MELKIIYGIIAMISLILIVGYSMFIRKRDIWVLLLYVSVFIVNSGYFALSIAHSLGEALLANRIAYLGSVFLPLCMLMIIMDVCHIKRPRWFVAMTIAISVIVFTIAASGGYATWYYESVSVVFVEGVAKLLKVYGPLHNIYYIYLLVYLGSMICMITFSHRKKKAIDYNHAVLLTCLVLFNEFIWFVEQLIHVNFEFLSISYIITEVFLLFLYGMIQAYEQKKEIDLMSEEKSIITPDLILEENPIVQTLTAREKEVLKFIMEDMKRKDIAENLSVSENTIKKHTANIFDKLGVVNRKELYAKLNYRP